MITVLLNITVALLISVGLLIAGLIPWYWALVIAIVLMVVGQVVLAFVLRHYMAKVSTKIQAIMTQGQTKMQAKVQRWRSRQMTNAKAAEAELAKDRDAMIAEVQAVLKPLEKYHLWVPFLSKQLATMELQFAWQKKDYKRVDLLLPKALLLEPMLVCIKLARMYQKEMATDEIRRVFQKAIRRARYGTTALVYATFSWILVKRNATDEAYKLLLEADEKNENATIKSNVQLLANNKINHFSNAAFGDEWYSLWLEEPKVRAQRMQPGRYFN